MEALDGNAIAGTLLEGVGAEMTAARGSCAHCNATAQIAELRVYLRAPGTVLRCPSCEKVVMVLAETHGALRIDSSSFRLHLPASEDLPRHEPHGHVPRRA
jgi:hypothetical protein